MTKITIKHVVQTAIISAFTFAAALIWKDVIVDFMHVIFPPREELFYNLLAALIATIMVLIIIYFILKTEAEAELIIKKIEKKNKKK